MATIDQARDVNITTITPFSPSYDCLSIPSNDFFLIFVQLSRFLPLTSAQSIMYPSVSFSTVNFEFTLEAVWYVNSEPFLQWTAEKLNIPVCQHSIGCFDKVS
ncbi:hypothetical protein V8G54_004711 [Vigna mungo]|uniref:Uncharacterized protein n=1 Tax=Vigna mungo TaxID=3915 RepID=A0AAQ3PHM4_VIGMU